MKLQFEITPDHPCFAGHFPGFPVFPAVAQFALLTETLAALHGHPCTIDEIGMAKFLRPVVPGMSLSVELTQSTDNSSNFVIVAADGLVAKGRLKYSRIDEDS